MLQIRIKVAMEEKLEESYSHGPVDFLFHDGVNGHERGAE